MRLLYVYRTWQILSCVSFKTSGIRYNQNVLTNPLICGIGEDALEAAHFHSFVLWGSYRHEGQIESSEEPKKADY